MERLTPRERRQARTREEILDAALELIGKKGPDAFSLRALARKVDYSPAGLYEYFDSKEDIIGAVCLEGDRRLLAFMQAVPTTLPPKEYLVELGLSYISFAEQNVEHFKLMFTQVRQSEPIPYEELEFQGAYRLLLDAVQAGIDAGVIVPDEGFGLVEIAYGLWAAVHGLAMLQLTSLRNIEYDFAAADRVILEKTIGGLSG